MTAWLFQANPNSFDVDVYLSRARLITWTVNQKRFETAMEPGDRVFIWRAGGKQRGSAGIVASGWLTERPRIQEDDAAALDLWKKPQPRAALRVRIRIDRVANAKEMVQRRWLENEHTLRNLRILRFQSETNYRLSTEEAERLAALWEHTGRDWDRSESIAGLWAYHHTYRRAVSRKTGSPVGIVAQRIGRAISGVYNKVMNFRSIDARDEREGLAGGGAIDRAVWAEFYDARVLAIRGEELDAEFARLWPERSETEPESIPLADAVSVTTGRSGQGFISDPKVRKAVEDRAMKLAEEYYRQSFTTVANTAKTKPYDFYCTHGDRELCVEVKGSTGDAGVVRLTIGEVRNARGTKTDLFLVGNIRVEQTVGGPVATGGTQRVIEGWEPSESDLSAEVFRYRVPE
jgi:hypothetical protein